MRVRATQGVWGLGTQGGFGGDKMCLGTRSFPIKTQRRTSTKVNKNKNDVSAVVVRTYLRTDGLRNGQSYKGSDRGTDVYLSTAF